MTDGTCDSPAAVHVPSLPTAVKGPCWGAGVAAVAGIPPTGGCFVGTQLSSISFIHVFGTRMWTWEPS